MTDNLEKIDHRSPNWMRGFWYYLRCNARRMPRLVNLEITKRCNARCDFCSCWQVESKDELTDYGPVIKKFRPVVVSVSGGEPLMRKDYADVLKSIRPHCHYLGIITNGALLNEKSARKLVDAGVDHISISLDYLGAKHDEMRKVKGLFDHLSDIVPRLASQGYRIVLNSVIMESNLDQVLPIAYQAKEWGVMISYSAYCALKRDDGDGMIRSQRYSQLMGIVAELKGLKRRLRHIKNSDYYLDGIPSYFRDGGMPDCKAGYRWVQITPDGYVQQCSELPRTCHYSEYSRDRMRPATCTKCWYTCRGEAEAQPLKPSRLWELIKA
jgi:MoaA/NifB/PqqE/SkfB family radical SAM enzyme